LCLLPESSGWWAPLKCLSASTRLQGATSQKTDIFYFETPLSSGIPKAKVEGVFFDNVMSRNLMRSPNQVSWKCSPLNMHGRSCILERYVSDQFSAKWHVGMSHCLDRCRFKGSQRVPTKNIVQWENCRYYLSCSEIRKWFSL
jgi:hypothetical protein